MRVVLDADLFAGAQAVRSHRELLAIFGWGYDGRHAVTVDPGDSPDLDRWLGALDPLTQEMFRFAIEAGVDIEREEATPRFTMRIGATHADAGQWRNGDTLLLSPQAAVDWLARPLKILVENRQHDGAFLRVAARVNGKYAAKLNKIFEQRWAELDSNGGITTNYAWVDEESKDPRTKTRLCVLFDSDALAPGKPHGDAKDMAKLCTRRGLQHHMLKRRAIESYLPLSLLDAWRCLGSAEQQKRNRARVESLASFKNEDQRYHYNMWEGFDGDARRKDVANVGDLYKDVHPHILDTLRHGIAYDIADLFHEKNIAVRDRWLVEDKQEDEIMSLLNGIFSVV